MHVLVVEDSQTQAHRLQLELMRHNLTVTIATTGSDGLNMARSLLPNVIILDIELPEMDGYSVCRALKQDQRTCAIPIVMLTHRDSAAATLAGLASGAIDYIPKDDNAVQNVLQTLRIIGVLA